MPQTGISGSVQNHNTGNTMSHPEENGRDRLPECDPNNNGYAVSCIHENRPLPLNDIARPVFCSV